jgi:hypothetical protein
MNALNERGCDSKSFGTRITGIRVMVEKIWLKEFQGLKCKIIEDFPRIFKLISY